MPNDFPSLRLTLTGQRTTSKMTVILGDRPIHLTPSLYSALALLVHARLTTQLGFVPSDPDGLKGLSPVTTHRLRRELSAVPFGENLIETAVGGYRLAIAPGSGSIEIDSTFREAPRNLLPDPLFEDLAALARRDPNA